MNVPIIRERYSSNDTLVQYRCLIHLVFNLLTCIRTDSVGMFHNVTLRYG